MTAPTFAEFVAAGDFPQQLCESPRVRTELPSVAGAYILYDVAGSLLYVGMSRNLRSTILSHLADSEDNPLIRGQIGGWELVPTGGVRRAAAEEGRLFDDYLRRTGSYPPANRHRPPGSRISDDEIVRVRRRKMAD